jgi:hypothetical protein
MPAAQLADIIAGPPVAMPDGWRHWPNTRAAHALLVERFLANMPAYPSGCFAGRGAVLCGGGNYEAGAYVACRMLRHVGWRHPIQVWHLGEQEPIGDRLRRLADIEVVDADTHPARRGRRTLRGWEMKIFAALNCPFEEVLFLDADAYPVYDPDECFEPRHNPNGIVTWPDISQTDDSPQWASYGLTPDGQASINGGHYVFSKPIAWPVLQLAQHYDDFSDYYYCRTPNCVGDVGGFGDQDQVRVALHKLGISSHRYARRPLSYAGDSLVQAGPCGRPLFVHRINSKFGLPGQFARPPQWAGAQLPMEAVAWRFYLDWVMEPRVDDFPDDIAGSFTRSECELWSRLCEGRDVLELGRSHGGSTVAAARTARRVVSLGRSGAASAELWLQRCGVRHKVWLRDGPFAELISSSGGPFSACLIAGDRDFANVAADIEAVVPHLDPGAIVAVHGFADPKRADVQSAVLAAARRFGWSLVAQADFLAAFSGRH